MVVSAGSAVGVGEFTALRRRGQRRLADGEQIMGVEHLAPHLAQVGHQLRAVHHHREGRLQRFRLGNVSRIEMAALDRFVAQFTENTEVLDAADAANNG